MQQYGKIGVLVNFVTQKLKSKHLTLSVFVETRACGPHGPEFSIGSLEFIIEPLFTLIIHVLPHLFYHLNELVTHALRPNMFILEN